MNTHDIFDSKSGPFSVTVYTPNSDPISDVHCLLQRRIGSVVRGCAKTCRYPDGVGMFDIENDRLFWHYTSSSSHGGTTSSALANLDH